mmetsp:Transcript_108923/g.292925  ORF Transcript_108923/g.292925 Transcript_108923/m.292925 type:complete len:359 (-) Transcript_108923:29-1105(-)
MADSAPFLIRPGERGPRSVPLSESGVRLGSAMGAPYGPHGGLCLVGEAGQPTRALLADLQLWRPWRREGASIHKAKAANATHACSAQQRGQRIKQRRRRHPAAAFAGAWQAARHRSHGACAKGTRAQRRRPPAARGVLGAPSAREVEQHPLARGERALAAKQLGALDLQRLLPSVQRQLFFGQLMCALQPRLRLRVGPLLRSWGRRQGRGHRGGHHRAGLPHCIRESYPPAAGVGSRVLGQLLRLLRLLQLWWRGRVRPGLRRCVHRTRPRVDRPEEHGRRCPRPRHRRRVGRTRRVTAGRGRGHCGSRCTCRGVSRRLQGHCTIHGPVRRQRSHTHGSVELQPRRPEQKKTQRRRQR